MFRQLFLTILATLLVAISGCGTIGNVTAANRPEYYGGTSVDAGLVSQCTKEALGLVEPAPAFFGPLNPFSRTIVIAGALVDLPLSFVGDTLTLPYVFSCQLVDKAINE